MAIASSRISSKVIANPPSTHRLAEDGLGDCGCRQDVCVLQMANKGKQKVLGARCAEGTPYALACPPPEARSHACSAISGCQRLDDLTGRDHLRLAWEDALGQEVVDVSILIGAAMLDGEL